MSEEKLNGIPVQLVDVSEPEVAVLMPNTPEYEAFAKEIEDSLNSPEHKELEERILGIEVDPAPFQCINIPGWTKWVESNNDPYGRAAVVFAAIWARNMDRIIIKNSTKGFEALSPEEIDQCSKEADELAGGITGFMFGAAVQMLSECWRYGKELQKYHNKQFGVEDIDGTVDPSMITIG